MARALPQINARPASQGRFLAKPNRGLTLGVHHYLIRLDYFTYMQIIFLHITLYQSAQTCLGLCPLIGNCVASVFRRVWHFHKTSWRNGPRKSTRKSRQRKQEWVNGRAKDTGGRRWSVFRECHDRFGVVTGKGRRTIWLEDRLGTSEIGHKGSGVLVY